MTGIGPKCEKCYYTKMFDEYQIKSCRFLSPETMNRPPR